MPRISSGRSLVHELYPGRAELEQQVQTDDRHRPDHHASGPESCGSDPEHDGSGHRRVLDHEDRVVHGETEVELVAGDQEAHRDGHPHGDREEEDAERGGPASGVGQGVHGDTLPEATHTVGLKARCG